VKIKEGTLVEFAGWTSPWLFGGRLTGYLTDICNKSKAPPDMSYGILVVAYNKEDSYVNLNKNRFKEVPFVYLVFWQETASYYVMFENESRGIG